MKQLNEKEALNRVAAYCSGTERCISDVQKKLTSFGIAPEVCERIITRLIEEKFIDENRYAYSFVNDKLRFNKWGRIRLDYEMKKKGIPTDIRLLALENINLDLYHETLYALLKDKMKSVRAKDQREKYFKLLRFATGRGFENQEINNCLKEIFKRSLNEDME